MRKMLSILILFLCFFGRAEAEYVDHRGHNADSLETVMAGWKDKDFSEADEQELEAVAVDLEELMLGFLQTNSGKSEYYARMLLGIARRKEWPCYVQRAAKNIGQHFWVREKYDSAAFYYGVAMQAVQSMSELDSAAADGRKYSQKNVDDALSQMYGSLGNLYSMMDSIDVAMGYYEKAGELFKKYGWDNSSSVLYYNMGETMRFEGDYRKAEEYYLESLKYSGLAADSLAVATAKKGLGSLYMETGKTAKALGYLVQANEYFAVHEKDEPQSRMESLDYMGQVLAMQKKRLVVIILLLVAVILMATAVFAILFRLKKTVVENKELVEVLENTVADIGVKMPRKEIKLKAKELEVLSLVSKGYTNAEIATAMNLSPETIKWYKKKLFAMFDASNSAELVKISRDEGIL